MECACQISLSPRDRLGPMPTLTSPRIGIGSPLLVATMTGCEQPSDRRSGDPAKRKIPEKPSRYGGDAVEELSIKERM